jgi:hypothetical protein
MPKIVDGPGSPLFTPIPLKGNTTLKGLEKAKLSKEMAQAIPEAPSGQCVAWGIPFHINRVALLRDKTVTMSVDKVKTPWLVFMHTSDCEEVPYNKDGFISPSSGFGRLAEHVADYIICYADGTEERFAIRRRHQIGMCVRPWGENCFEAVAHKKPFTVRPLSEQLPADGKTGTQWGWTQTRTTANDGAPWMNWLVAWENPHPNKAIVGFRFEPLTGTVILSAITAGKVSALPIRWETRRKAIVKLPRGEEFDPTVDVQGRLKQIQLDMGQVVSAQPRTVYPNKEWSATYNNKVPEISETEVLVEYSAHADARFHVNGKAHPVAKLEQGQKSGPLTPVAPATQRVRLRVIDKKSKKPVPVKLHVHGEAGEYLAPVDRHRIPNPAWFEDYSAEYLNQEIHYCTYIPGETVIDLPLGRVYLEVSKGFEIKPVRKMLDVTERTKTMTISIEKVLPWREQGWVTSDTHVHFLSPPTAQLEGSAEGVNVINLLASQWGELMTNVGDFDGKTTFGSKEAGGNGEWLVRVGTENRQHVLGHISLLGYDGDIIAPMCSGGADEAALGDPVGVLMMEWARQCQAQGGIVVMPHFPNPRCENAATLISGSVDAIEMCSWGNLYRGIDPYSLSDYYRYLNCGYFFPCVGGTDKMSAGTAVGTIRTYVKLPKSHAFDYQGFKDGVRKGHTFVTYGPLMDFHVDGKVPGSQIRMSRKGGTVDVSWHAASVTVPMSRIELVVNGEIRESKAIKKWEDQGQWRVKVDRSSWVALLLRGHYKDQPEMIAAHSSPVMVQVEGSEFFSAADAVTMVDQIEGAIAYLDVAGTRAETERYKKMRALLTAEYRKLHNKLHQMGHDHAHGHTTDHKEHH